MRLPNQDDHLLQLLHRHYTDVLFDALKQRCPLDNHHRGELTAVCRKLERFFCSLRNVHRLYYRYVKAIDVSRGAPLRAVEASSGSPITVIDALQRYDY